MIDFVFTLDYELDGRGKGRLAELVYDPTERLRGVFEKRGLRFVTFVEAVEFEKIEERGTDPAIGHVERQIRELHQRGFEIGFHLHPQWCNAQVRDGQWVLDWTERNICRLSEERIGQVVDDSLRYLRCVLGQPNFTPLVFRAGGGLFQPSHVATRVLAQRGLKLDSSVSKGFIQRNLALDYRPSLKNGHYWTFGADVNTEDPTGTWIEVPVHTQMVPFWRKAMHAGRKSPLRLGFKTTFGQKVNVWRDRLRLRYPLKLDFCQRKYDDLVAMTEHILKEDRQAPEQYRPVVAIGHTPDLADVGVIDAFLAYLHSRGISVVTFETVYGRLAHCVKPGRSLSRLSEAVSPR
jgi:hypothetical protein